MYASKYGHYEIVRKLLQYKIVQEHIHDFSIHSYDFQVSNTHYFRIKLIV